MFNDLNFLSKNISFKKIQNNFLVNGNINHKVLDIKEKNLSLFLKPYLPEIDVKKLRLSSNNDFSFKVSKKFKFHDFKLDTKLSIDEFSIINKFNLKK